MTFTLAPDLAPVIQPAALIVEGVAVVERDGQLDAPIAAAEARARLSPPAEREAVRAMYRHVGLDPTKRRPSSEALLRRIAKGEPLPRINSLVDICNWCSLEFQLPYGLYMPIGSTVTSSCAWANGAGNIRGSARTSSTSADA